MALPFVEVSCQELMYFLLNYAIDSEVFRAGKDL